jgi:hypothetical protein
MLISPKVVCTFSKRRSSMERRYSLRRARNALVSVSRARAIFDSSAGAQSTESCTLQPVLLHLHH